MTSSSLTDWLTDSLTAMIHVVLKRFISLASQSLHPISKILTLVFCLSLKSMSWVDKTHCNWNHLETVAVSSIMSSESGEVSCVLWESGKISHQPLEAEDMSHKPLEGGEIFHLVFSLCLDWPSSLVACPCPRWSYNESAFDLNDLGDVADWANN